MSLLPKQNVNDAARAAAVSANSDIDPRLSRLEQYQIGSIVFWCALAVYKLASDVNFFVPLFCAVIAVCSGTQLLMLRGKFVTRGRMADVLLLTSLGALLIYCNIHPAGLLQAQFFFPVICLIASHFRGVSTAIRWYGLVIIVTFFCYYPLLTSAHEFIHTDVFGVFIFNMILSFTVMWLSGETELYLSTRSAQQKQLTDTLKENTRLLELAEETAGVGHWRWNLKLEQFQFSAELNRILGITDEMVPSIGLLMNRFETTDAGTLYSALQRSRLKGESFSIDLEFKEEIDTVRYVTVRGICQHDSDGQVDYVFGVIRDDTALKQATSRLAQKAKDLKKLASYDPLTGLANRFQFRRHLHRAVERSVRTRTPVALLVLDMDGFKEINDMLGHAVGDLVLKRTARRIRKVVGKENVVARLGGDEFTVILKTTRTEQQVMEVGQKIVAEILRPMYFENHEMHVGASIGACFCPDHTEKSDELFRFADTAMYAAKYGDDDVVIYNAQMTEELVNRKRVESKLSVALERDEFHLVYQPQVNIDTGQINGFEALVRWNQNGEAVSPANFIPMLESTGRIIEVGTWIIQTATQQAARWAQQGHTFTMAINISPLQFREDGFVQTVIDAITSNGLPAEYFDIEITETMLISDVGETSKKLKLLRDFGTKISIDDFGTGYSSLAYLKNFPIDRLKIDRTFIQDFPAHDDGVIASSIIVLGQSLDLEVLAEGVETPEQLEFLKQNLCNSYQGHLFSPAIDPEACLTLLNSQAQQSVMPDHSQATDRVPQWSQQPVWNTTELS